jgi:hypothetical protein
MEKYKCRLTLGSCTGFACKIKPMRKAGECRRSLKRTTHKAGKDVPKPMTTNFTMRRKDKAEFEHVPCSGISVLPRKIKEKGSG